jgi:ABC-type nitrate/sulfonate/bicarbonate transport system permease component
MSGRFAQWFSSGQLYGSSQAAPKILPYHVDAADNEVAAGGLASWIARSLFGSRASGVLLILLLLSLWQYSATYIVNSPTWPPVTEIFRSWFEKIADGTLIEHLFATLWRQMAGYFLAVGLGVALGLAMGYFRALYSLFEPLVELLRPIPGPAYLPVLVLFVGIGNDMKVILVFIASFFPILLNTYSGVRSIDPVQFDTTRTLGLTTLQTFRELVVPASGPYILTGMRISLAISLILAILGEMIVSNDGLGYFVLLAQRTYRIPEMYAGLFTIAVYGYFLNRAFLGVEGWLIRWHHESSGRD